mmetsp:Transcript_30087/g.80788  ORF Transcript_30087/g.80788 Transcript_30087/m.80788 type:complete len:137 (+) Transcript_30087:50-460(+)
MTRGCWRYLALALITAALRPARAYSIYCGDERYCDDDQTCCKSNEASTHYFCCGVHGATCCSDMKSCCPPEFPVCDLEAGGCVGTRHNKHGMSWRSATDHAPSDPWRKLAEESTGSPSQQQQQHHVHPFLRGEPQL